MPSWSRSLLVYVAVPSGICAGLILLYFSESRILRDFVAPTFNRELGALENLQNVLLIAVVVLAASAALRKPSGVDRAAFAGIAVLASLVFLEEIDYGLHHWESLMGALPKDKAKVRNIHNIGHTTEKIKLVVNVGCALLFVLAPLAALRVRNPYLQYLAPSPWAIATIALLVVLSKWARYLQDSGFNSSGALRGNLSEFEELLLYYLSLVYLADVARRPSPFEG